MWQATWVQGELEKLGHSVELVQISTKGDVSKSSLSQVGGQGVFTKEIQLQLLAGKVDVAVHSLKDLPTDPIAGLHIAAVPPREITLDCLICREKATTFKQLPAGSSVGTGSTRRAAQLLAWRPDIQIADIRGNVDTRLKKLEEGEYDAIILAAAGLSRLGLYEHVSQELPQDRMLPAIGQGALGLECRSDDTETTETLAALKDEIAFSCVQAERRILNRLGAGCLAPVAALATVQDGKMRIRARVLAVDGSKFVDANTLGDPKTPETLADEIVEQFIAGGAMELIEQTRA